MVGCEDRWKERVRGLVFRAVMERETIDGKLMIMISRSGVIIANCVDFEHQIRAASLAWLLAVCSIYYPVEAQRGLKSGHFKQSHIANRDSFN